MKENENLNKTSKRYAKKEYIKTMDFENGPQQRQMFAGKICYKWRMISEP